MAKMGRPSDDNRNRAIYEYSLAHPDDSLREIGRIFGNLSIPRIWAILDKYKKQAVQEK